MAHQKSKDEIRIISRIHEHIMNATPSGKKIREAFCFDIPFISTEKAGGNRTTHYDFKLNMADGSTKTVEFKGSKDFKPIYAMKSPWMNGVQFYNGPGNKLKIGHSYARQFYEQCMDKIIADLCLTTPKPTYEEWSQDAFRQGKPKGAFVCELRQKGYRGKYLSDLRKEFNRGFVATPEELDELLKEFQEISSSALNCKDYWLQIHGDIEDPDKFHVKWTDKITMPKIVSIEQLKTECDINFKFTCENDAIYYAKMRWGYGQCISNIRVDIK